MLNKHSWTMRFSCSINVPTLSRASQSSQPRSAAPPLRPQRTRLPQDPARGERGRRTTHEAQPHRREVVQLAAAHVRGACGEHVRGIVGRREHRLE